MPSPKILTDVRIRSLKIRLKFDGSECENHSYRAQSIAKMMVISLAGIFTADITNSMVTRPAEGIEAAPTEATVAVKLERFDALSHDEDKKKNKSLPHDHQLTNGQTSAHQLGKKYGRDRLVQCRSI